MRSHINAKTIVIATAIAAASLATSNAFAWSAAKIIAKAVAEVKNANSTTVAATGTVEVAFSPDEGAENLVIKVINSAHSSIHMLAYSFTSAPVTQALLDAKHRGVDVKLVADYENNLEVDRNGKFKSPKAVAALSALATAGVDVRTIKVYPIHHDKVILADQQSVELGSFNYSDAAAHRNSENVLVNWNNPALAKVYEGHFERNYARSQVFVNPRY
ncbi:phospholipase D family protein [Curvibacter sp. APW13]|uniref:phospholipase D family nuclease n=1 Tax=Curvibacter sp. APW13 TaxID=3077236 RepID=UPI0028DF4F8A|nr:phospholipase D family protein [Curvibacter sp. APW13]MDT8992802.1 phospholipase D family protein [Curvibacter sp. APW13]